MKSYQIILGEIAKLQALADKRRRLELASVISSIKEKMRDYGITVEDLGGAAVSSRKPSDTKQFRKVKKPTQKLDSDRRVAVAPKYRDPDSGITWSGRGLTPKWLVEKEKEGKSRVEFLIQN